jgi:hypothetical protein
MDPGGNMVKHPITFEAEIGYELKTLLEKSEEKKSIKS